MIEIVGIIKSCAAEISAEVIGRTADLTTQQQSVETKSGRSCTHYVACSDAYGWQGLYKICWKVDSDAYQEMRTALREITSTGEIEQWGCGHSAQS